MEIKRCPFCGSDAELNFGHYSMPNNDVESLAYIVCCTCGAKTANHHASSDAQAKKLALHAWNMREDNQ